MTRIILESGNNNDVKLIKELAARLNMSYKIQSVASKSIHDKDIEHCYKIINKVIDVSNYGDPSEWQKKVREDRSINIS